MNCARCHFDVAEILNPQSLTDAERKLVEMADDLHFGSEWAERLKSATVAIYGVVGNALSNVSRCTNCGMIWREWPSHWRLI